MLNEIKADAEQRMQKSIEAVKNEFSKLRTGRASPALLEHIMVPYYGADTPMSQVANIAVADARTLTVTPWEKDMIPVVEKAIMTADLGLNPASAGNVIRVPLPPLNEERRKDLTRLVKSEAENGRIAIRNIRRDANNELRSFVKDKTLSEDDERRGQEMIQKLTDSFVAQVDKLMSEKESELMEI